MIDFSNLVAWRAETQAKQLATLQRAKKDHQASPDEIFAEAMAERCDWVAAFIGLCTACGEYMHRDGDALVCMTCPVHETLTAADFR